ncbi:MAG TPA: gamma-glutamyltransferase [Verrucomicrobiae bacterium]
MPPNQVLGTRRVFGAIAALWISTGFAPLTAHEPVRARQAMVVTVEPHATDVGVATLQSGGNAVDAAVAVGLALAVTHPSAGNLGGGGFMLIRLADGRTTFIDFRERAPGGAHRDMYLDTEGRPTKDSDVGYRASGVPGTPRGLEFAHRKYGGKPWAQLVKPAVQLASKGFPLSYSLARGLKANQDRLSLPSDSRRIFLRNGRLYEPGEILKQPELARTLRRLMKSGAKDFYEGETARLIAADMQAHGGLITLDDLRAYKVVERHPLTGTYRGYSIITAPPPSSGGVGILQMLGMLEPTDFEKAGAGSARTTHYLAEAMRRFFADRSRYLGDPDFYNVPTALLLDPKYIADRRQTIDPEKASPSTAISAGTLASHESRQTTHYSIVDAAGNAVAVTYTLNGGYGSGVTAAGTGVLLNNEMDDFSLKLGAPNLGQMAYESDANAISPRKTPLSSMTPTIVLRDGRLFAVLGTPGGPTIINTVLEVLVNLIDFKMNVTDAVDSPRFHHQWMPDQLEVERGFSPDTIERLKARGHNVKIMPRQGEVAAIVAASGWLEGAADPRTEGTARGY